MKEASVDIVFNHEFFDAICIPTNGQTRNDGQAIMGKGFALAIRERWPEIAKRLGGELTRRGNVVSYLGSISCGHYVPAFDADVACKTTAVFSFPTKKKWKDRSDLRLITESAKQLVLLANHYSLHNEGSIAVPRPGCGNGGLLWEQVKPVLARFFDDRFVVVAI